MKATRRTVPYPGVGSRFYLTATVWNETIATLSYYGDFKSEGLVYWGGAIGGVGETIVTSLLKLNHTPQGGIVRPTSQEMRALLRTLRQRDEKLVAQIHSHPGGAFHSFGDDQHATSYHPGFISIVLPNFGKGVHSLLDCAIYEFRSDFEALTQKEIAERFVIQPQIVDLIPSIAEVRQPEKGSLWSVLNKKLRFTVFKRQ